jgi:hypothetical protein
MASIGFMGLASNILDSSLEFRALFDRSKHQPALDRAARHYAVVRELAVKALGGLNSDQPPVYISQAVFNERKQAWIEYEHAYKQLMQIMEPRKKNKAGKILKTVVINTKWPIVKQLIKDMDKRKAILDNANHTDRIELLSDRYRSESHQLLRFSA